MVTVEEARCAALEQAVNPEEVDALWQQHDLALSTVETASCSLALATQALALQEAEVMTDLWMISWRVFGGND